jgi:GAF domain-containing protein
MQQSTITIIVACLAVLGTLGGVIIGQRMTRDSQHKQWLRDKKTEEYRELLDALTAAYMDAMERSQLHSQGYARDDDDEPVANSVEIKAYHMLRSRLFTAVELDREEIPRRWPEALIDFRNTDDTHVFAKRFDYICAMIVWLSTGVGERPTVPVLVDKEKQTFSA